MASRLVTNRLLAIPVLKTRVNKNYSTESGKNVAFVGLGNMGMYMAANLVKKGYTVLGYDASPERVESAPSVGVKAAASVGECVRDAAYVVTALPNNDIVRKVYTGKDGVVANVKRGTLLIDSSTVEPTVSQEIAKNALENELSFIDAPMSGGVMGAKNATLSFMVGGTEADLARAEPLLSAMGARHIHCGPVGSGEIAKLVNNLLMAINMIGASECLNLGIRMGLEPSTLLQVVNNSTGRSWCSEVYCPVPGLLPNAPSTGNYVGGFKTDLLVKDLGLVNSIVASSNSPTPLGALVTQLYKLIQTRGDGEKDFSYVYQFLKK